MKVYVHPKGLYHDCNSRGKGKWGICYGYQFSEGLIQCHDCSIKIPSLLAINFEIKGTFIVESSHSPSGIYLKYLEPWKVEYEDLLF